MDKYHVKRLNQGKSLHIVFREEVHCSDITIALGDCSQLLLDDPAIRHLIFDCTKTTRLKLSNDDIKTIARQSAVLTTIQKDLIMTGVMDRDVDYGLFRMWKSFVDYGPLEVDENQTHVV